MHSLTTLLCMLRLLGGKVLVWKGRFRCLARRVGEAMVAVAKSLRVSDRERRGENVVEEFWTERRQCRGERRRER